MSNSDSNDSTSTRAAKAHDLCCVGTALIDYLSTGDFALVASLGIEPGAMTLIDGVTAAKVRDAVGGGQMASGGTVANTAAGVASLGGHPVFVGAVAGDDLGERYATDLEENGIRAVLELLPAMDGGSTGTGTCYVIVTPDSQRTMATTLGVSGQLHATAVDATTVGDSELVYFDGYLLDFPEADQIVDRIIELAKASGTKVALGLADPFVVDRHGDRLKALAERVDVLFSNEDEARAMTGAKTGLEAVEQIGRPGRVTVVTMGAEGARIISDEGVTVIPAAPVTEVVDTTGAGDLFAAGVCFGLSHNLGIETAGKLGALCAAEAISHLGARPATSLQALAQNAGLL